MSITQKQIGGDNCVNIQIAVETKEAQNLLSKIKAVLRLGKQNIIDIEQEADNEL